MGTTPVGTITAAGFARPAFSFCLDYRQSGTRAIYGQDLYLGEDCQDGQIEVFNAQGIFDVSGVAQSAYNAFSPQTAMGSGLDRVVKSNGIRRKLATYSTAPFRCVGQAGTVAEGITITDPAGFVWALPAAVQIPNAGEIIVTGTCQTLGAITLAIGAVDTSNGAGSIGNPARGFQSVNNVAAASPGQPVETDNALRQRQAISTALPSLRLEDGLAGALAAISGVNRLRVYDNTKGYRDLNGVPGHCVAVVLDGGDALTIAQVIALKKGPSTNTYGSTIQTVTPATGPQQDVGFFYLAQVPITYSVTVQNLGGYTQAIEDQWKASLVAFVNGLDIGESVRRDQAFAAAKLYDGAGSKTFKIVDAGFRQSRGADAPSHTDVPIAFNEAATCLPAAIVVTVLPAGN